MATSNSDTWRLTGAGALCPGAGCRRRAARGTERNRVAAGLRLCTSCLQGLTADLSALPVVFRGCEQVLGGPAQRRERTSGGGLPGMPFNAAAAEVRSSILGILASWTALVVDERGTTAPRRAAEPLATFLLVHLDWLAGHPAAGELSQEVADLARHGRRVAFPDPASRVPVGRCVEPGCAGELVALLGPRKPVSAGRIVCRADPGHAWAGSEWLQLSQLMRAGATAGQPSATAGGWLSARDVAQFWHVPVGTVYRYASQHRWRRVTRSGHTYYDSADVADSFTRTGADRADST
jgi:hypothetical protein